MASSRHVLLFVILQILPALDRSPPLLIVAVPLDGRLDRLFKPMLRRPTELALHFARIDCVAPVMSRAVLNVLHRFIPALAHLLQDDSGDATVGNLIIPAYALV